MNLLLGGSSHAGKSTLARALAERLGWECVATDTLARHPGRPWGETGKRPHVIEHYSRLAPDELLDDVLRHYQQNVWPQVTALLERPDGSLVIEGSALWPESIARLNRPEVAAAIFLTAPDAVFTVRIFQESGYGSLAPDEKRLVDSFLARTLLYNRKMRESAESLGLAILDSSSFSSPEALADEVMRRAFP